jgi:hypothetical protein
MVELLCLGLLPPALRIGLVQVQLMDEKGLRKMLNAFEKRVRVGPGTGFSSCARQPTQHHSKTAPATAAAATAAAQHLTSS